MPVLSCECQCARGWVGVTEVEQSLVIYVMCVRVCPSISLLPLCFGMLWNICIDKLYAVSAHKPQNVDNNNIRNGYGTGNRRNSKYFDVTKPNWAWQGEHHMLLNRECNRKLLSISSPSFSHSHLALPRLLFRVVFLYFSSDIQIYWMSVS